MGLLRALNVPRAGVVDYTPISRSHLEDMLEPLYSIISEAPLDPEF